MFSSAADTFLKTSCNDYIVALHLNHTMKLDLNDSSSIDDIDADDDIQLKKPEAVIEPWVLIQTQTFANWVNEKLRSCEDVPQVRDLRRDLGDGVVLCKLVQELTCRRIGPITTRQTMNHHEVTANLGQALNAIMMDGVKLVNIGPEDICSGNLKLILGLIWSLIRHYQISRGSGGNWKPPPKKLMLSWINAVLYPHHHVTNFRSDWNDGIALNGIVDYCSPGTSPDWFRLSTKSALSNCERAMTLARDLLGVPIVVSPENFSNSDLDDLSSMTYLSYFISEGGPGYNATLRWIQQQVAPTPVDDFTASWRSGETLSALVHSLGGAIPFWQNTDEIANNATAVIQTAMTVSKKQFEIDPVISAKEMAAENADHIGTMAYVAWHQAKAVALPRQQNTQLEMNIKRDFAQREVKIQQDATNDAPDVEPEVERKPTDTTLIAVDDSATGIQRPLIAEPDLEVRVNNELEVKTHTPRLQEEASLELGKSDICSPPPPPPPLPPPLKSTPKNSYFQSDILLPKLNPSRIDIMESNSSGSLSSAHSTQTIPANQTPFLEILPPPSSSPPSPPSPPTPPAIQKLPLSPSPSLTPSLSFIPPVPDPPPPMPPLLEATPPPPTAPPAFPQPLILEAPPSPPNTPLPDVPSFNTALEASTLSSLTLPPSPSPSQHSPYPFQLSAFTPTPDLEYVFTLSQAGVHLPRSEGSIASAARVLQFNVLPMSPGFSNFKMLPSDPASLFMRSSSRSSALSTSLRSIPTNSLASTVILENPPLERRKLQEALKERVWLAGARVEGSPIDGEYSSGKRVISTSVNTARVDAGGLGVAEVNGVWVMGASLEKAGVDEVVIKGARLEGVRLERTRVSVVDRWTTTSSSPACIEVDLPKPLFNETVSVICQSPTGKRGEMYSKTCDRGRHIFYFEPDEIGTWTVRAFVNDVEVLPNPKLVKVSNPQLAQVTKSPTVFFSGDPATFFVDCSLVGDCDVAVDVIDSRGERLQQTTSTVTDDQRNVYRVDFVPLIVGQHRVSILCAGINVPGSPFDVFVADLPTVSVSSVVALGNGLSSAVRGKEATFVVRTDLKTTRKRLECFIIDPRGKVVPRSLKQHPYHNEVSVVTYTPTDEGNHTVVIRYGGKRAPGSPFTVRVRRDVIYVQHLSAIIYLGEKSQFVVNASEKSKGRLEIDSDIPVVSINRTAHNIYNVTLLPHKPGKHDLIIKYNEEVLPGCPYIINVLMKQGREERTAM